MAALKKSPVWNYFEKINNNKQASCLHCQMKITLQKDGNTSSMSEHLLVNTPRMTTTKDDSVVVEATEIIRKKSQPSHQPTITASLNKLKPYSADSLKHKAITHAIGRFVAQDIQPLDFVNDSGILFMCWTLVSSSKQ